MSIVIRPDIFRQTLYSTTWKDELYNRMYKSLYDSGILKTLSDKGRSQDEDGVVSDCTYLELFFFESYINYLILLKDEATKTTLTEDEITDLRDNVYRLGTIRSNFLCRFGNTSGVDVVTALTNLGTIAGINNVSQDGLDYLIFDPHTETGPELLSNGDFTNTTGWTLQDGTTPPGVLNAGTYDLAQISALSNPNSQGLMADMTMTIGQTYRLTFNYTGVSYVAIWTGERGNAEQQFISLSGSGFNTYDFVASHSRLLISAAGATSDSSINTVSLKLVDIEVSSNPNDLIVI